VQKRILVKKNFGLNTIDFFLVESNYIFGVKTLCRKKHYGVKNFSFGVKNFMGVNNSFFDVKNCFSVK